MGEQIYIKTTSIEFDVNLFLYFVILLLLAIILKKISSEENISAAFAISRLPMPKLSESLHNLELYFDSLQYWFDACGVTSDAKKFSTIMAQIPIGDLSEIKTEMGDVPNLAKYEFIKPILVAYFSDAQQKRFREVINDVILGDTKPFQLYAQIKRLAGDLLTESALIELWAARLPEIAHAAVVQMKSLPIKDRLVAADALVDSLCLRGIQNNIQQVGVGEKGKSNEISTLEKLSLQIAELEKSVRRIIEVRLEGKEIFRKVQGLLVLIRDDKWLCWYHFKYGTKAHQCIEPCNFEKLNSKSSTSPSQQN